MYPLQVYYTLITSKFNGFFCREGIVTVDIAQDTTSLILWTSHRRIEVYSPLLTCLGEPVALTVARMLTKRSLQQLLRSAPAAARQTGLATSPALDQTRRWRLPGLPHCPLSSKLSPAPVPQSLLAASEIACPSGLASAIFSRVSAIFERWGSL